MSIDRNVLKNQDGSRIRLSVLCIILLVLTFSKPYAQPAVNAVLLQQPWKAQWIRHPEAGLKQYEVYHFRKTVLTAQVPEQYVVHVSVDSRYKLFVNGTMIGLGPARSDLMHWNFDTYDLKPYLRAGRNAIAAVVWNGGEHNAYAQHSYRTAFILQGNTPEQDSINTTDQWKVLKNESYAPVVFRHNDPRLFWQYYVAGALDGVNAAQYPWGWQKQEYDDAAWSTCKSIGKGYPAGTENATQWNLVPRPAAFLQTTHERFADAPRSTF